MLLIKFMKISIRSEIIDPWNCIDLEKFPYIVVLWHNRMLFLPIMIPKKIRQRTMAIVSLSRDGQYAADILDLLGIKSIHGSSSKYGAVALREAIRKLKTDYSVVITPDGPRGPRYKMSKGPVILASKTGFPVLPIAINASNYWEIRSWDRFQIPKPWSKLTLLLGEPVNIPPELNSGEIEYWRNLLEQQLNVVSNC